MSRCCDICGIEIGTYNSRYTLTYKSILYSSEKDICPLCFEKLQEQFKRHEVEDEPQIEEEILREQCRAFMDIVEQTNCSWKKGAE